MDMIHFNSDEASNEIFCQARTAAHGCADSGFESIVRRILNKGLRALVRTKKRVIPNFRLETLPFYAGMKRWLFGKLRQTEVTVHGFRLRLDPVDSLELSIFQSYEPFETQLLTSEIQQGQTIIDVGANIGYYTLLFSMLTGDMGRVFALEPEPHNYKILRENIDRNGRTNIVAVNKAAGDVSGESFLYLSSKNYGDHQAYASDENRDRIIVQMAQIDDLVCGPVDLVKLDVQGFEFAALKGMRQVLLNNPAITLFTEFCPAGLHQAGSDAGEFLRFLRSQDFEIFYINEYANRLDIANDEILLKRYSRAKGSHTNLLCRRTAARRQKDNRLNV